MEAQNFFIVKRCNKNIFTVFARIDNFDRLAYVVKCGCA
jgi:hypothetical protein